MNDNEAVISTGRSKGCTALYLCVNQRQQLLNRLYIYTLQFHIVKNQNWHLHDKNMAD